MVNFVISLFTVLSYEFWVDSEWPGYPDEEQQYKNIKTNV